MLSDRTEHDHLIRFNTINNIEYANDVPQGSSLGPLLFIYYINDLIDLKSSDNIISFADDVVIYDSNPVQKELENSLQDSLDIVVKWCSSNRMKMNLAKTKLLKWPNTQHSGQMSQNIQNWKKHRNTTSQANWDMW